MLTINNQTINLSDIKSVGFNTRDGRHALLSDGTKVAITFAERQLILDAMEAAESEEAALYDDQTLEDMAEYYRFGIQ